MAEGEKLKLLKQGEADGLRAFMEAQAQGTLAQLQARANGFRAIVEAAGGAEQAAQLMVTEQLPKLVEEQVKAIANLKIYGPFGVGSGQADSIPGMGIHNFLLEQYGEGGVLTTLGVLGWLILPVVLLRRSRLELTLAWSIVAMMAGLMVHGLFWSQFLNGLRFLTLAFVCLWTALATQKAGPEPA